MFWKGRIERLDEGVGWWGVFISVDSYLRLVVSHLMESTEY